MSRQTLPLSVRVGVQTLRANPDAHVALHARRRDGSRVARLRYSPSATAPSGSPGCRSNAGACRPCVIGARTTDTVDGLQVPRIEFPCSLRTTSGTSPPSSPSDTEVVLLFEGRGTLTVAGKERAALILGVAAAQFPADGLAPLEGPAVHAGGDWERRTCCRHRLQARRGADRRPADGVRTRHRPDMSGPDRPRHRDPGIGRR